MPYSVILLQEDFTIRLGTGGSLTQAQSQAVNLSPFRFVIPFVHVRTSAENNIPTPGMMDPAINIVFSWLSAAALPTPSDLKPPGVFGDRFVELSGGKVTINEDFPQSAVAPKEGKTFTTAQLTDGGFTPISNPGGLLIWKCTNDKAGPNVIFHVDIYLVCRGDG